MVHRHPLLVALALAGVSVTSPATAVTSLAAEVNGMVCAFCAQGIEKKLRALPATRDVYVNLPGRLVAVELVEGANLETGQLAAAVREAGYEVVSVRALDVPAASLRRKKR